MRPSDNKILFAGPVGAGKTTAIASLSDIPPVRTDAHASDMTLAHKRHTTVALDYGVLMLDEDTKVHLYGTPGQERFDFMWDILSQGCIGLVLLLDASRPHPLSDLQFYLQAFDKLLQRVPLVVGVTKTDLGTVRPASYYADALHAQGWRAPIFEVDARQREDLKSLVCALLYSIDPGLEG